MSGSPVVGRCQHCQQIRPVFHLDATFDNGDPIWTEPYPDYWATIGAWLCARDYSAAETARAAGHTFHVDHMIEVWFWKQNRGWGPFGVRFFTPEGELLTQADRDLETCNAILTATEEAAK